jgi:hypothetical protein
MVAIGYGSADSAPLSTLSQAITCIFNITTGNDTAVASQQGATNLEA